jgi:hypothetical protein
MTTRWICIGTLRRGGQILRWGGSWSPCAVSINWRGLTSWCQPWQFEEWPGLWWAVERRLGFAGLQPLAYASRPPNTGEFQELWVEVRRRQRTFPRNRPMKSLSSPEL